MRDTLIANWKFCLPSAAVLVYATASLGWLAGYRTFVALKHSGNRHR
jgi:hypothetical protein